MAESWPIVRANRWLVERLHRRVIQVRFPESWSSTFSGEKAVLAHRAQDISVLTTPSLLSRVERFHRRVIQVRFPESWSSTFSGEKAVLTHRPGYFCLDNAFALIDGHPAPGPFPHRIVAPSSRAARERGIDPRSRHVYVTKLFYKDSSGRIHARKTDNYAQKFNIPTTKPDVFDTITARGSAERSLAGRWLNALKAAGDGDFSLLQNFRKNTFVDG